MILQIFQDALFSAIAAIGFAAISNPPRRAYPLCALIAAAGHSIRYILMTLPAEPAHIVPATLAASFAIGLMAVFLSPVVRTPAETCLFPSLLPMIPGIYAYKAFGAAAKCALCSTAGEFDLWFMIFARNFTLCACLLLCLVVGATLPIFIFKKISFQATR